MVLYLLGTVPVAAAAAEAAVIAAAAVAGTKHKLGSDF